MSLLAENPYYNNPRQDLDRFLPEAANRILDLGCATGGFGARLKARYGADVVGIEYVPDVAERAREVLDEVVTGDAVEAMRGMASASFDLVTANDVLEHLAYPGEALREAHRLLRPGGLLVTSLPNVRYWLSFERVLWDGDWKYEEAGIMDRTHLRFFTERSIQRWLPANGFEIEAMEGLHPMIGRKLRLLNLLTGGRFRDCAYLQFGVRARRMEALPPVDPVGV